MVQQLWTTSSTRDESDRNIEQSGSWAVYFVTPQWATVTTNSAYVDWLWYTENLISSTRPELQKADHMPLSKLQFKPGVNQEITSYSNEGGWRDCDKIRFRFGYPEKIGGWEKYTSSTYLGSARALHNWIALDGSNYLGIGTHLKYYIEEGQGMNDITPIRATTSAGDVTFAATNGSTTITVSDTAHGAFENDFVTFSGAASLGGQYHC